MQRCGGRFQILSQTFRYLFLQEIKKKRKNVSLMQMVNVMLHAQARLFTNC